uniref:Uncharacterized protein n=1 Tax=Arundo donax TaxID=35708 RepID=A0A0A9GRU5_ARUDO
MVVRVSPPAPSTH